MPQANTPESSPAPDIRLAPAPRQDAPARAVPLTPKEHQQREAVLREQLTNLDLDHSGDVSQRELRNFRAASGFADILNEVQDRIDVRISQDPAVALRGVTVNDVPLFNRDVLVSNIFNDPRTSGLTRSEIDRVMREVLPGGVASITLADQCDLFDVGCQRIGADRVRVMPRRDGPTP